VTNATRPFSLDTQFPLNFSRKIIDFRPGCNAVTSWFVVLQSQAIRVAVAPDHGARVTSLVDLRTGREWLTQGEPQQNPSVGARYGLREAAGWDECFPTVSSCTIGEEYFRDHGELWGRPWIVETVEPTHLTTLFRTKSYAFRRELRLGPTTLRALYRVDNLTDTPKTALWAMHPLFALRKGETIDLKGVRALRPTFLSNASSSASFAPLPWPEGDARLPFTISHVQGAEARFAGKFFGVGQRIQGARLGSPSESIEMRWRGLDHVGLWMTYGAWPSPNDVVSVAVEPTTSPHDSLAAAIEQGIDVWTLPARGAATWEIRLSFHVNPS
jgi:galactose mutarotase-like enzyme